MLNIFRMAWRNVWRHQRRTLVTIAAMTLALVVEVLYSGLITGMFVDMEDDVTEMETGDVQVMAPAYLEKPSLYTVIEDPLPILEKLDAAGYRATYRLQGGGMAATEDQSAGVAYLGLDPVRDAEVLSLSTALAEGRWLDDSDPLGVVVGRGLARTLGLSPGSELIMLSQAADGSMANTLFTVRGILMSVASGLDRGAVLMPAATFRDLFVMPEGAHKIIIRRPEGVDLAQAAAAVKGMAPGEKVMTWSELNPVLAQMLQGVQGTVVIIYLIVYVAVAILILNAMLMAVFERIREFGVLKAIGYSPLQVLTMMLLEGMIQATVATVLGLLLAAGPMWYIQTHGINVGAMAGMNMVGLTMPAVWRGYYDPQTIQLPVFLLFFIVMAAVSWPALKAAFIKPVDAMHHQ